MKMRTSMPEHGNKFYNNGNAGGWSWCVNGSPTQGGRNVLSNCVGYACGRFNEIIGSMKYKTLCCNAENFIERAQQAGLQISNVPSLGGIMVWQKGATLSGNDGAGHVEVVERIDSVNQIYTSASNWGGTPFYNALRTNSNGRWGLGSGYKFRGCIVNPAVGLVTAQAAPSNGGKLSVDEVARKVVAGEYGNNPDRKNRLIAEGYNYDEVQAKVNEIVNGAKPSVPYEGVSDEELARRVWNGEFGNGDERKAKLGSRYSAVQSLVDRGVGKPAPAPQPAAPSGFNVGDAVTIVGAYASSANASSATNTRAIGWHRYITKIHQGARFPYQIGNQGDTSGYGTTGFADASAIRK